MKDSRYTVVTDLTYTKEGKPRYAIKLTSTGNVLLRNLSIDNVNWYLADYNRIDNQVMWNNLIPLIAGGTILAWCIIWILSSVEFSKIF